MAESQQEFRALHKYAHISATKVRGVANLVRGLPVNKALSILQLNPKRGSYLFKKVLESAVANAAQDESGVNVNRLMIKQIWADHAGLLQGRMRWRPGPMGRAMPIRKRMSHLGVVVAERAAEAEE